eukprot:jgi/Picre1/28692/NNA_004092.t1
MGPDVKVTPHWSGFPTIKGTNRPGQTCRSKDSDDDSIDIDELAKRLSVEAERLRSEGGSLSSSDDAVANQSFESVEEFQPMSDSESSDGDQWEMLYKVLVMGVLMLLILSYCRNWVKYQ